MGAPACPRCGGSHLIAGSTQAVQVRGSPEMFRPWLRWGLRYFFVHFNGHIGVQVRDHFQGCRACGLVWGDVSPAELAAFIAREKVVLPAKKGVDPEL